MGGVRWTVDQYNAYRARHKNPEKLPIIEAPQESPPQRKLYEAMELRWPGRFRYDVEGLIPGRRFRADIADVEHKLIVELDGWRSHGLSLTGFTNDRERDYQFVIHGWVSLRIPAGLVIKDLAEALQRVETFIAVQESRLAQGPEALRGERLPLPSSEEQQ